jgi:hypothetical protein
MDMLGVRTVAKLVHVGALVGLLAVALLACKKNKEEEKALPEVDAPEAGTTEPAAPTPTPAEAKDEAKDDAKDDAGAQPSTPGTTTPRTQPRADAGTSTPRVDAGGGSAADAGGGSTPDAGGGVPAPTPEQIRSCISRCQGQLQQCLASGNNAECNSALRTCIGACRGN